MAGVEVFKNDQMTVFYHQTEKIIHHVMNGQVYGQPFHDAILAATNTMIVNHAIKWLSDDRLNPMLKPTDQKWVNEEWQPKILAAGWKYWALILPAEAAGKLRMGVMAEQYKKLGVTVNIFSDPDEGFKWLAKV